MSKMRLFVLVGLPQSGKSTWALANRPAAPIVNPDSIRIALHGQLFYADAEDFVWATAKLMVRSLFLAGHDSVILDATNTTHKRRKVWQEGPWLRTFVTFSPFPGDALETREATADDWSAHILECLRRAAETALSPSHLSGLQAAIDRMAERYEPVSMEELWEGEDVRDPDGNLIFCRDATVDSQ